MSLWPRTKKPIGFSLEYLDWRQGESPREVIEHFDDRASALRRAAELRLRNFSVWHSDGISAAVTDKTVVYWYSSATGRRWRYPDRETGALKRLETLMLGYPELGYYVQGDPRGAALYVLPPGTVPDGADVDAYYSRGIAVYR